MNIKTIQSIQAIFGGNYDFDVYITNDEDKGLHVCWANIIIDPDHIDHAEEIEFLKSDGRYLYIHEGLHLGIDSDMENLLKANFVKVSTKRETIYIDYERLYDERKV